VLLGVNHVRRRLGMKARPEVSIHREPCAASRVVLCCVVLISTNLHEQGGTIVCRSCRNVAAVIPIPKYPWYPLDGMCACPFLVLYSVILFTTRLCDGTCSRSWRGGNLRGFQPSHPHIHKLEQNIRIIVDADFALMSYFNFYPSL